MNIPESVAALPAETHTRGQTVYWWTGTGWESHIFVAHYPEHKAVKIKHRKERLVPQHEIISRERYLFYKASQARK